MSNKTLIPLTCWIDVVDEEFPTELFFAGYKADTGWIMRGPFIEEERARESLQYFNNRGRKLFRYKLERTESIMKVKNPNMKFVDSKTKEEVTANQLVMKVRQPKKVNENA